MRTYMRGLLTGGLLAAGAAMWLQRRSQRRHWLRLGAKVAANAAQGGRHILARATR